jgi:hypothetical protein
VSLTLKQAVDAVDDNLMSDGLSEFVLEVDEVISALGVLGVTAYDRDNREEVGRFLIHVQVEES